MVWYADTLWCDGCGVEIRWKPEKRGALVFCCKRCLIGEVCDCEGSQDEYPANQKDQQNSYTTTGV